ncbi:MAG: hypothetical protein ERJ67_07900 [Aphanocapsa feldmannii 277cV]|uniref:Uncharacterized protein n=2 Tax=Aphanocapsa feldmannii TaxID=192050 RepID=A0A524RMC6_9CHRO|nr:MAG: hypothetical protein ERJ69_05310 [Aphanocapsa feldmannii 288cV]TGG91599.1 MAG: hypothetical protein ERJ67_07900 [Aphanocapsa feldmannii 277cV]TGH24450.1 MAG: hypothetical protein ERJ68_03290 [Aphanocapsa feldmannii 277cI]
MDDSLDVLSPDQAERLRSLTLQLLALGEDLRQQPRALLVLLRDLDSVHRHIQNSVFRAAMPSERNALYHLLQDIERSGGWPYIPRPQISTFLDRLDQCSPAASDRVPDGDAAT